MDATYVDSNIKNDQILYWGGGGDWQKSKSPERKSKFGHRTLLRGAKISEKKNLKKNKTTTTNDDWENINL